MQNLKYFDSQILARFALAFASVYSKYSVYSVAKMCITFLVSLRQLGRRRIGGVPQLGDFLHVFDEHLWR